VSVLALGRSTGAYQLNPAGPTDAVGGEPGAEEPMNISWSVAVIHGVDVAPAEQDGRIDREDPTADASPSPAVDKMPNQGAGLPHSATTS
jgi:hypothetical protein